MVIFCSKIRGHYIKCFYAACMLFLPHISNAASSGSIVVCASGVLDTAYCDYIADGIDDQVEINAALEEGVGVSVELSEGYFYVTSSINVGSRDSLHGQGRGTAILPPKNFNNNLNLISLGRGKREQHIFNLFLDGNREAITTGNINGIYGKDVTRSRIESVIFWGFGPKGESNGIWFGGRPLYISIINNHFEWISDDALDINFCSYCVVSGNTFRKIGDNAIDTEASYHTSIIGNTFFDIHASAIEIEDESTIDHSAYMTVVGNTIDTAKFGVYINAGRHSTVSANTIRNTTDAIRIKSFSGKHSTYNVISGNVIDKAINGIIESDENQNFNSIIGNTFTSTVENPLTRNGANSIVRSNVGYTTESSGTATILSGNTFVAINHGLSVAPSAGDCMAVGTENVGVLWVNGFTPSQFIVNVNNQPDSNGFDIAWTCSIY